MSNGLSRPVVVVRPTEWGRGGMSGTESDRRHDAVRRSRHSWRRWYKLDAWQRLRRTVLIATPLCARCERIGATVPATVVNHITPHRGDWRLFTSLENLEAVCEPCHNATIQAEEARGFATTPGSDGWPRDPDHPANRGAGPKSGR